MAVLFGVGVGCFVGVTMHNPDAGIFGQSLAWAVGTGASVSGGVLLLVLFFRWASKFADPDTVQKFQELERRAGLPPEAIEPRRRLSLH